MTLRIIENAESIAKLILNKPIWEVWQAPEGVEFITSDNPLVSAVQLPHGKFHPGYGFGKSEIVGLFPLAPTACLAAGAFTPGAKGAVGYRSVNASIVTEVKYSVSVIGTFTQRHVLRSFRKRLIYMAAHSDMALML